MHGVAMRNRKYFASNSIQLMGNVILRQSLEHCVLKFHRLLFVSENGMIMSLFPKIYILLTKIIKEKHLSVTASNSVTSYIN